jgi:branched-chain amino acid transport system permease protein
MRAAVANRETAELMGVSTRRLALLAWAFGTILAAVATYLYATLAFLGSATVDPFLVKSFAVAALGAFESFEAAILGGLFLGIADAYLGRYMASGFRDILATLFIVLILFMVPRGLLIPQTTRE